MSFVPKGFNPLRWDCDERGCFNKLRRPKIELFADCFPNRISFGDIDGIVEINGRALVIEWKSDRRSLPAGQRIMYQRLTESSPLTVICIVGDAETMVVSAVGRFARGQWYDWEGYCLEELKNLISRWAQWAQRQSPFSREVA